MILLILSEGGRDTQKAEKSWTFVTAVSEHKPFHDDAGRAFPAAKHRTTFSLSFRLCIFHISTLQKGEEEGKEGTLSAHAEPRSRNVTCQSCDHQLLYISDSPSGGPGPPAAQRFPLLLQDEAHLQVISWRMWSSFTCTAETLEQNELPPGKHQPNVSKGKHRSSLAPVFRHSPSLPLRYLVQDPGLGWDGKWGKMRVCSGPGFRMREILDWIRIWDLEWGKNPDGVTTRIWKGQNPNWIRLGIWNGHKPDWIWARNRNGGKTQTGSWLESRTGENPDCIRAGIWENSD